MCTLYFMRYFLKCVYASKPLIHVNMYVIIHYI